MAITIEVLAQSQDEYWMRKALDQAVLAAQHQEVPVGAVLVAGDTVLAAGYNCPISRNDVTAHAEINVLRAACEVRQNYRLPETCLYVTLEPCTMCLGAIVHSRVARVVFAASEPRAGALVSAAAVDFTPLNHSLDYTGQVLAQESAALLKAFFWDRRR